MEKKATAIILAAGAGKRMQAGRNKQFLNLAGQPVLAQTLAVFEACHAIERIILVAQASECAYCQREIVAKGGFGKVAAIVPGGSERQDSVYQGLLALPEDCQWVAVHDGARPLVTAEIIERVLALSLIHISGDHCGFYSDGVSAAGVVGPGQRQPAAGVHQ